jgi:hypothetical protein
VISDSIGARHRSKADDICVVSECDDRGIREVFMKKIFWPKFPVRVGKSLVTVSGQAVTEDNTVDDEQGIKNKMRPISHDFGVRRVVKNF